MTRAAVARAWGAYAEALLEYHDGVRASNTATPEALATTAGIHRQIAARVKVAEHAESCACPSCLAHLRRLEANRERRMGSLLDRARNGVEL